MIQTYPLGKSTITCARDCGADAHALIYNHGSPALKPSLKGHRTMAALRTATGTLGRAVHVKIQPRPANLAEGREVLRILERFGEVVYFKNLRVSQEKSFPQS